MLATFFGLISDRAGGILLIAAGVLFWVMRGKPNKPGPPSRKEISPKQKRIAVAALILFGCMDLVSSFREPAAPPPTVPTTTKITGDGKFEVYLRTPFTSSENGEQLFLCYKQTHRWVTGTDPNAPSYSFRYSDYDFAFGANHDMIEVTETMVRTLPLSAGLTVQNRKSITLSGFPATHVSATSKNGDMTDIVLCAVGQRIYMLIRECGKMPRPASDDFFDRFRILGQ